MIRTNTLSVSPCLRGESSPLTTRNEPVQRRDIIDRLVNIRAATIDEATRSVEVTIATENPVTVFDWERGIIDEVLMADGGQYPMNGQMPLLANHMRYSLDDVLGAVREFRRDGANWVGRAYFASGDEEADKAWNKVKQRVLTDVSVGYRSTEYVDIPAGQTATVAGRSFTASNQRALRITTRYEPKELSLVPIGADRAAKVRTIAGDPGKEPPMDPQLRTYLESLGLRADASVDEAKAFHAALGGVNKTRADKVAAKTLTAEAAIAEGTVRANPEPAAPATPAAGGTPAPQQTPEQIRAEALRVERERVTQIRSLAGTDVDAELVTRAESEGWTVERASREFLAAIRERRAPSVGADSGRAPGGIVRDRERDATRETLGVALFMRSGGDDQTRLKAVVDRLNRSRAIAGQPAIKFENLAERAYGFSDMSLLDVCREAIRMDNNRATLPVGRDEIIRAAVSGGALTNIFTTSVNAMLLMAYEEEPDTTVWVEEGEVADFKTNTAIKYAGNAALKKLGRGGTAEHASAEDSAETYKIARYAKQFVVDDQDIIDDSMNALSDMPREFGQASRRLRPDLVYALLLANPTMSDGGTVTNSTALTTAGGHANYAAAGTDTAGGALAAGALQAAITAMRQQYRGSGRKVALNIVPQYLLVPSDLQFTAEILLQSAERIISASSGGTFNPLKGKLTPVVDSRLGTVGVTDPDSGTAYTGTATNYWLASRPGLHMKVAYRRGTGRAPQIRAFTLDKGQWGIGWDVAMDIGAKFVDFRGIYKAKGAA